MMRRIVLAALGVLVVTLLLGWGGWKLSGSRSHQLFGEMLTQVQVEDSIVALTFDDGPGAVYTDTVLAMLDEFDASATFFMVGRALEARPEVAARVVAAGHELGNHSWSHARMVLKSPGFVRREIEETDARIREAGQEGEIFFRPPYGKRLVVLPWYLARAGRPAVLWDLEPDTWFTAADDMVEHVLDRVRPGSIILLHVELEARREGRRALRQLVPALQARGYRFVTLSELVAAGASEP
jgi:peptidoglycan/xylan/chitin deacetylase (PgdA/CDA1 family)